MISEKGVLRDTPAIKLLLSVFEQRLTGILYLKRDDTLKVLYFNRGKFTWAISNADEDRLETLLIDKKLIDGDTVELFRKSVKAPESLGKTLVENGLLTLENLVSMTRAQLEKIVASVLAWTTGSFQFVRDTPPERLVSLDMEIPIMVHHCVQEYLEMDQLWKEIGTLQVFLQVSPDTAKLALYPLSEHQKEIMGAFRQPAMLEPVLARFSGSSKHPVLKSVYFLMAAGLLTKSEAAPLPQSPVASRPAAAAPAVAAPTDDFAIIAEESKVQPPISIDLPPPPASDLDEEPTSVPSHLPGKAAIAGFDPEPLPPAFLPSPREPMPEPWPEPLRDSPSESDLSEEDFLRQELHPESPEEDGGSQNLPQPFAATLQDSGHSHRLLRWTIVLAVVALVAGGVYMLLLRSDSPQPPVRQNTPATVPQPRHADSIPAGTPPVTPAAEPTAIPEGKKTPTTLAAPETTHPKPPDRVPTEPPKVPDRSLRADPWGFFHAGNLLPAADVWREELKHYGIRYSILIELDCQKESVMHAYSQFDAATRKDFFLLNRRRNGHTCWLVMWGRFMNLAEAEAALARIPGYFFKQSEPPAAADVAAYL
jgi:hypothetical protein